MIITNGAYIDVGAYTNGFRRIYNIRTDRHDFVECFGYDLDFDLAEKRGITHVTLMAVWYHLDQNLLLSGVRPTGFNGDSMLSLDQGRAFVALGLVSMPRALEYVVQCAQAAS